MQNETNATDATQFRLTAAVAVGIVGLCYVLGNTLAEEPTAIDRKEVAMKREVIRVEPLSNYLEAWKAPTSAVTRAGDTVYVSGFPPFDPSTGTVIEHASIERQTELVLDQMKLCLEAAGSDLEHVLKCNVYCTAVDKFAAVNAVYTRYFPKNPPARIFINVPATLKSTASLFERISEAA
jgi:2-iminobutanoate/2-iminopropanoate deaminase